MYTDQTKIEDYLDIDIPTDKATLVTTISQAVTNWINNYIGKSFIFGAATDRYYDGSGTRSISVDPFTGTPIITLLDSEGDVSETLSSDDYILYPLNNPVKTIVELSTGWYSRFSGQSRRLKINATYGYATVPADIELAATMLASGIYNSGPGSSTDSGGGAIASESLGDYSISYQTVSDKATELGMSVTSILDMYREIDI